MNYPAVMCVAPQANYVLALTFDNGEQGTLDMKPYLSFGVFSRLVAHDNFCRVKVSFDTVEWDSGADLDPAFVYQKCVKTSEAV